MSEVCSSVSINLIALECGASPTCIMTSITLSTHFSFSHDFVLKAGLMLADICERSAFKRFSFPRTQEYGKAGGLDWTMHSRRSSSDN